MEAKGRNRADQAALLMAGMLALAGCADRSNWPDPAGWWREASGRGLAQRLPPPGLDGPPQHLGLVPARPDRPSAAALAATTRALVEDRERAAQPRGFGAGDAPPAPDSPGSPPVPGAPPPPPRLAAAPAIPWAPQLEARPVEREGPRAGQELAPGAVPDLPPPELLAPAPPPLPDVLRR